MTARLVKKPVYQQLNAALRQMIASGEVRAGQKFLSEREIGRRFKVSRATANKAVSNLVAEGILVFKKGVGTFVRRELLGYDLARLVSFTDYAWAEGMTPSTKVLGFEVMSGWQAPENVQKRMKLVANEPVYWIERLRLADGAPMILERRYVAARFCPNVTKAELEGSLYHLWAERYKLEVFAAEQTIRAIAVPGADAKLLDVAAGSPGMLVSCVGLLRGEVALWHENTLYRADWYEFHSRFSTDWGACGGCWQGKEEEAMSDEQ
ncbi:MAG: GntR family transcriptional regulator [Planctomycetes bacterium]|nr:GntR family transcriptional regulator [Planctomycetota bacterium]